MNESQIIRGCIKKDPACQRLLFEQYAGKMMGVCLRYATDHQLAQDFLQLGFIKVFDYIHQFKGNGSFEGWLRRVFASVAIRELGKRKLVFEDIESAETDFIISPAVPQGITEEEIHSLIRRLPEGYRLVFNLHVVEGYSHEEIAVMLSIQPATSRTQLFKARKMLQGLIVKRYNNIKI